MYLMTRIERVARTGFNNWNKRICERKQSFTFTKWQQVSLENLLTVRRTGSYISRSIFPVSEDEQIIHTSSCYIPLISSPNFRGESLGIERKSIDPDSTVQDVVYVESSRIGNENIFSESSLRIFANLQQQSGRTFHVIYIQALSIKREIFHLKHCTTLNVE